MLIFPNFLKTNFFGARRNFWRLSLSRYFQNRKFVEFLPILADLRFSQNRVYLCSMAILSPEIGSLAKSSPSEFALHFSIGQLESKNFGAQSPKYFHVVTFVTGQFSILIFMVQNICFPAVLSKNEERIPTGYFWPKTLFPGSKWP